MRGFFSTAETDDFQRARDLGERAGSRLEFTLTITIDDVERMIADPDHSGTAGGEVRCAALAPQPLAVTEGRFSLLPDNPDAVATREMRYALKMQAADGTSYFLYGFKTVRNDPGFDLWADTTTLRIKVYRGTGPEGAPLGAGMIYISVSDFARQLTTFEVLGTTDPIRKLEAQARFGQFFAGQLFDTYGGVFVRRSVFNPDAPPRRRRPLDVAEPEVHLVPVAGDVVLKLTRYRGGARGPVLLVHGLGVSSGIFSLDTIRPNLVEYLFGQAYDVWLLDYRASIDLPYAHRQYTADDVARVDYPAAVRRVLEVTAAPDVQLVVHCFGATTFFMAMLAGLRGVRSAVVSQIATHMRVPRWTELKAVFHAADALERLGLAALTAKVDTHTTLVGRVADLLLQFYPVHDGPRDTSPVSRRISFLYGQLYELDQLNQATYDTLHELFGIASIASLEHLATMVRHGKIVDAQGGDVYLREADGYPQLQRLALPLLILHGAKNQCWLPESTQITLDLLRQRNDPRLYERKVIPDYGHIDCIFGARAARDVYPDIRAHLDRHARSA